MASDGSHSLPPAPDRSSGESAVLRFVATFLNTPWPMTRGEAVRASAIVGAVAAVVTVTIVPIGRGICTALTGDPRELAATLCVVLVIVAALTTITAFIVLLAELFGWAEDVRLARDTSRRYASYYTSAHTASAPMITSAYATADDEAAALLDRAIATRDAAIRDAARLAHLLNVIHREISK